MESPSEEKLRELLARVHERLTHAGDVEPESRELLITLTRDIERMLGVRRSATPPARHAIPRLEALAAQFEAGHPALAQVVRQLIDALGKAGI
jgi:predicted component of type VI protein secretion system